jgi:3'-phosphoadenosine 5'-phosphosulfate sulfotransferase (PAPS reductase)/FAD synthetase
MQKTGFSYSQLPKNDTTLVSFSMGKDSLATYLEVRDHFENVVPFYLHGVPGLEFVEDNLAYYERMIGRHIIRLPQPRFYEMLNDLIYQPPDERRIRMIWGWQIPNHTHDDIHIAVCRSERLDPEMTYTAIGLKMADSIQRRTSLQKNGTVTHSKRKYYPIAHYNKDDVLNKINAAGWKLPSDYLFFKDSLDGFQIRYLLPIKKRFPRDYQRILEWFPLAEAEVMRYERFMR